MSVYGDGTADTSCTGAVMAPGCPELDTAITLIGRRTIY